MGNYSKVKKMINIFLRKIKNYYLHTPKHIHSGSPDKIHYLNCVWVSYGIIISLPHFMEMVDLKKKTTKQTGFRSG